MQSLIIKTVSALNGFNEWIFSPIDGLIDSLSIAEWLADAIKDSLHMLPFLFLIFVVADSLMPRTGMRTANINFL